MLDANVKEMSEKIARLASTLESTQQERNGFEAKLEQMDERMRKLSSLTEMISAQYNPFVGDAPTERSEMPQPEVGLAPPPVAGSAASFGLPPPPPVEAPPLGVSLEGPPPESFGAFPSLESPAPMAPMSAPVPIPLDAARQEAEREPAMEPLVEGPAEPGVYLWSVPTGFESSMLLLGWADMLLKSAGSRESLVDLANYYHNIGWIGDTARDQLLAYADGLVAPAQPPDHDWRADVEVHEKSLLFVEKLRAVIRRKA